MKKRPPTLLFRLGVGVAVLGFLCAFTYPMVEEGYQMASQSLFEREQKELLRQSIVTYIGLRPNTDWNVSTSTEAILSTLAAGLDRDFDATPESFLPPSETVESLSARYRIIYKNPQNIKIVAK